MKTVRLHKRREGQVLLVRGVASRLGGSSKQRYSRRRESTGKEFKSRE